uniref:Uncharacterized protein n=2 Tax=Avena sativa TaxID=4498 RepID=A0ACD5WE81_AVESA
MACDRLPSSPEPASAPMPAVAAPLEDESLLPEILLRLSSLPSSLPRASLVCNRWRHLVTDRRFVRRFRAHHRRNPPPLLGFFDEVTRSPTSEIPAPGAPNSLSFNPILDSPDRLPVGRFSFHFRDGDSHSNIGCRDGLVLMVDAAHHDVEILVWDPVTGDEHRFTVPWVLDDRDGTEILNGAVLRTAGIEDDPPFRFQVVVVGIDRKNKRLFACAYTSETSKWGDPVWASVDSASSPATISMRVSSTLVGNSLYWTLVGKMGGILEFDLDRQHLSVIPVQLNTSSDGFRSFQAMPAEGGGLGILELLDFNIQLWKRKADCDGVVSWLMTKTIELDQLLSLDKEKVGPMMMGYCEDNNVVFLWTLLGIFMVHLESSKVRKPPIKSFYGLVHPFTSVYIPDMGIGGGRDRANILHNA